MWGDWKRCLDATVTGRRFANGDGVDVWVLAVVATEPTFIHDSEPNHHAVVRIVFERRTVGGDVEFVPEVQPAIGRWGRSRRVEHRSWLVLPCSRGVHLMRDLANSEHCRGAGFRSVVVDNGWHPQ
ncbi:hypothetical protein D3C81_1745060 [compost metagenome]